MKKTRLGMYSLAVAAFAMVITGCGGKKDESTENTAAPSRRSGRKSGGRTATGGRSHRIGEARRGSAENEGHQHGCRTFLLQRAHHPGCE